MNAYIRYSFKENRPESNEWFQLEVSPFGQGTNNDTYDGYQYKWRKEKNFIFYWLKYKKRIKNIKR